MSEYYVFERKYCVENLIYVGTQKEEIYITELRKSSGLVTRVSQKSKTFKTNVVGRLVFCDKE
jgi:hypothetical protein